MKTKRFCKNHTYFFLKNIFLFKLSFAMELLHGFATFEQPYQRCSMKKSVLRSFKKFTGNHLCQILFFNKVAGLRSTKWSFPDDGGLPATLFFTEYLWATASVYITLSFFWRKLASCSATDEMIFTLYLFHVLSHSGFSLLIKLLPE